MYSHATVFSETTQSFQSLSGAYKVPVVKGELLLHSDGIGR